MYKGNSAQEKFVVDLLKEKRNGYYLELGGFHSTMGSNTYHLENDYSPYHPTLGSGSSPSPVL